MDNIEKKQKNCKYITVTFYGSIFLAIILIVTVALFFFHLFTQDVMPYADPSQLAVKCDTCVISKDICNSSESCEASKIICNSNDMSQMQYIVAQVDLAVDKFSQWTGYWLSIISLILAVFTLIQAFTNYKSNKDAEKRFEEAKKDNEKRFDDYEKRFDKIKDNFFEKLNFERKRLELTIHDTELSAIQNRLSCISACISNFPDAFSLTPTAERRNFTRSFLNLLNVEYTEYVYYMRRLIDNISHNTGCSVKLDLRKDVNYVYLVWCDMSIAINRAMYDIPARIQDDAFIDLRNLLSTAISDYQRQQINSENVVRRMSEIQEVLEVLVNTLLLNRQDTT